MRRYPSWTREINKSTVPASTSNLGCKVHVGGDGHKHSVVTITIYAVQQPPLSVNDRERNETTSPSTPAHHTVPCRFDSTYSTHGRWAYTRAAARRGAKEERRRKICGDAKRHCRAESKSGRAWPSHICLHQPPARRIALVKWPLHGTALILHREGSRQFKDGPQCSFNEARAWA